MTWDKDAVFYAVHVKAFADGNGIGDFAGLIANLDSLQDLGVEDRAICARSCRARRRSRSGCRGSGGSGRIRGEFSASWSRTPCRSDPA